MTGIYTGFIATYRNTHLIFNPFAGKLRRKRDQLLQRTIDVLIRAGHRVVAVPTTGPNTAAAIARESVRKGAELILAAGGDGTINEVANGLIGTQVPLGLLPAGTANVLAVETGIGTRMEQAARKLSEYIPERIAVGAIDRAGHPERHFLLMAGAGLDAMIVYNINAGIKAALGKVAYWIGGFSTLGKPLAEFDVCAGGQTMRCSFALISRVRNYGGDLCIARDASLFSDEFALVLFEGAQSLPYLKYFAGVLTNRLANMKGVTVCRARAVEVGPANDPRAYVQVDGEYAGKLPVKLRIVPDALTLLLPPACRQQFAQTA